MTREAHRGPTAQVVSITTYRDEITSKRDAQMIRVLRRYLDLAEAGQLRGLSVCGMTSDGDEDVVVVGDYRQRPQLGIAIAARMQFKLLQIQDQWH